MTGCQIHLRHIGWQRSVVILKSDGTARYSSASLTTSEFEESLLGSCLINFFLDFFLDIRGCYGEFFGWLRMKDKFLREDWFECKKVLVVC